MITLLAAAWALEPEVGLRLNGGLANTDELPLLFGVGGHLALDPLRRLHVELAGDAGMTTAGDVWAGVGPRLRLFAGAPERTVLSGFLGGGVAGGSSGVHPLVDGGISLDLLRSNGLRPRVEARYAWEPGSTSRLLLSVGAVFGRKAPVISAPAALYIPPATPPPEPAPDAPVFAGEGMIWIPGPVCQWLPGDEAIARIGDLGLALENATSVGPRSFSDPDADPTAPSPEPRQGRIAVSATTADRVTIDRTPHDVTDGLIVVEHPSGRAEVVVEGGGRRSTFVVGVTRDNVVWVDPGDPEPTRVLFPVGSAVLDPAAQAQITAFAEHLGAWHVELFGSYSPEGNIAANRALGQQRAEAVHAALLAAQIPEDRIHFGPVKPPPEGLESAEMRNATLQPMESP